jgi:putative transposase
MGVQMSCGVYFQSIVDGHIRKELDKLFAELARHKESHIETGDLQPDYVHMLISIPPKYSVAQVIGYIKGKSAIHIARTYANRKKNFTGEQIWARGYFISTIGKDEQMIREYIRYQEAEDKRIDQLKLC